MNIKYISNDLINKTIGNEIIELIKRKPDAVLCFPSGATPLGLFNYLISKFCDVDISQITIVSLDEFIGLSHNDDGSCYYMLERDFFSKIKISKSQIIFFDGCKNNDQITKKITDLEIDYIVLGVGQNGHIGLNEPGMLKEDDIYITELSETTKTVMNKYFEGEKKICENGITMSLNFITKAQNVSIIINDESKKKVLSMVNSNCDIPVTKLLKHKNVILYIDESLGGK